LCALHAAPASQNPFDEIPDSDSLRLWLEAHPDGLLINILPENAFEEARIPGSKNACTYEMALSERWISWHRTGALNWSCMVNVPKFQSRMLPSKN
jgi:hypothetical protein